MAPAPDRIWSANQRPHDVLLSFAHSLLNRPSAFLDTPVVLFKISQISSSDLTIVTGSLCRLCSLPIHLVLKQMDRRFLTPCNFSSPRRHHFGGLIHLPGLHLDTYYPVKNSRRSFSQPLHQYLVHLLSGASTTPKRCEK